MAVLNAGQWKIDVNLSCNKPEKLLIRNLINGAIYSYGSENLSIDGELYYRKYSNSSILYDKVKVYLRLMNKQMQNKFQVEFLFSLNSVIYK